MLVTFKHVHIIKFDDETKSLLDRLITAINPDEAKLTELTDKLKQNTDTLKTAVDNNKDIIS